MITCVSTFKAFKVRKKSRCEKLAVRSQNCVFDILGIQEHHPVHEFEEVMLKEVEGMSLINSSVWREPTTKSALGGVGLLLSLRVRSAVQSVNAVSPSLVVILSPLL